MDKIKRLSSKMVMMLVAISAIIVGMCTYSVNTKAATYPTLTLTAECIFRTATVGETVNTVFLYGPAYNNEKVIVNIYNSSGTCVASSTKDFSNSSIGVKEYTLEWDTTGYAPGEYTIVGSTQFYSYLSWRESPNTTTGYITLVPPATTAAPQQTTASQQQFTPQQQPTTAYTYDDYEDSEGLAKPAKAKIRKLKKLGKGKVKITLKKTKNAKSYQIVYSLNKNFSSKKTKNTNRTTLTIKNLKKGKNYYFKVRAINCTEDEELSIAGKWSTVKKIKVK